jgi:hypothetical protein
MFRRASIHFDLATLDGDTAPCRGRDSDTFTLHLPGSVDI